MFTNNDGVIELEGKFPKKMSLKQAIRFSVEKHEFMLAELLAGRQVTNDGVYCTCGLCRYSKQIQERCDGMWDTCFPCPVCHKTGKTDCYDTPFWDILDDTRQNGSFRIPNVRREIKFLKALEADYA